MQMKSLFLAGMWLACAVDATAAVLYTVTGLGTLGGSFSYPYGINNLGQATGYSSSAGSNVPNAFFYGGGQMKSLGITGQSAGYSINDAGQVAGTRQTDSAGFAFLYSNGQVTDLGTLGGCCSGAFGLNNLGQVTGSSYIAPGASADHAFLYSNGQMNDLGTLGGFNSLGVAVNDSGHVAGWSDIAGPAGVEHAFLYANGKMTDLGTLGGAYSFGNSINAADSIAGYSTTAQGFNHAFLDDAGQMLDLGTLGGNESEADSVNNGGQVTGSSFTSSGANHAFLYSNGTMMDLNNLIDPSLGITLWEATAINGSGQILAYGPAPDRPVAYLLTPLPEPRTLVLATLALLLVFAARRIADTRRSQA